MKTTRYISCAAVTSLLLAACGGAPASSASTSPAPDDASVTASPDDSVASPPADGEPPADPPASVRDLVLTKAPSPSDALYIEGASMNGDVLALDLSYSGGCEPHDIAIHWSGTVMESNPPVFPLEIFHDAHGDACEAMLRETVFVDLAPLRAQHGGESGRVFVTASAASGGDGERVEYLW